MDALQRRLLSFFPLLLPLMAAGPATGDGPDSVAACLAAPRLQAVGPCEAALAESNGAEPALRLELERRLARGLLATYRETEAVERFRAIAERRPGDLEAQRELAEVLVGLRDYEAAESPLHRALLLGPDDLRTNRLAATYFTLLGRHGEAHRAYRRLAEGGVLTAMFDLAEDFAQGRGVEPDQQQARRWLEAAAGAGHVLAMRTLSEKLRFGAFGTSPEPAGADYWLRQAERHEVR